MLQSVNLLYQERNYFVELAFHTLYAEMICRLFRIELLANYLEKELRLASTRR